MKILAFFILLVSLAATFTPCCVFDGCEDEVNSSASSANDKKEASGVCSPFSSCTSCSGAVEIARIIQLENSVSLKIEYKKTELYQDLPSYHSSFWQPPRMS